ncbi:MAG: hypothetical protein JWO77_6, partial [Ilumatobacteraceae bacterium]|nr:hypothetical protein [Ilumatobacteraceae bacterium]
PAETAPSSTTAPPPGEPEPLKVMVSGDSVAWTVGYYKPTPLPKGIASIDSRAIIGCGLLSAEAWGYPQGGNDGPFTRPGSGACENGPKADALGLEGRPDVVLTFPGSWEWSRAEAPDGHVVPEQSPEMADVLTRLLLARIDTANQAGAQFVIVAYSCPGEEAAGVRKDKDFILWINGVLESVVDQANDAGGDARFLEPTDRVCIDADPAGEPTDAKRVATADEIHVASWEGGAWIWNEWLAPALIEGR